MPRAPASHARRPFREYVHDRTSHGSSGPTLAHPGDPLGEPHPPRPHGGKRAADPGRLSVPRPARRDLRLVPAAGRAAARRADDRRVARRRTPLALRLRVALRRERDRLRRVPVRERRMAAASVLPAPGRPERLAHRAPRSPPPEGGARAGRPLQRDAAALVHRRPRDRSAPRPVGARDVQAGPAAAPDRAARRVRLRARHPPARARGARRSSPSSTWSRCCSTRGRSPT